MQFVTYLFRIHNLVKLMWFGKDSFGQFTVRISVRQNYILIPLWTVFLGQYPLVITISY